MCLKRSVVVVEECNLQECNSDELLRIPSPIVHALYAYDAHLTSKMWRESKPELEIYPFDPDEWFNKLINVSCFFHFFHKRFRANIGFTYLFIDDLKLIFERNFIFF